MYFKQCLLSVVLALCLAGIADAIKCWDCQSTVHPNQCGEAFSESNKISQVDCSIKPRPPGFEYAPIPTRCSKAVIQDSRGKVVIRGCHYQNPNTVTGCTIEPGHATPATCESCTSDLCNGATQHYVAFATIILVLTSTMLVL